MRKNDIMTTDAIRVDNLTKRYGTLEVLRGVSLSILPGTFNAVIGKSGSGKSTLLGMVAGLEQPDSGKVLINGADVYGMADAEAAELRRKSIGIVFQGFNLVPSLTALANVLLPAAFDDKSVAARRRQRAEHLLDTVGLADRMHHRPAALSGGEQQRVAIARALINEPPILLADEPTGNLDETTGAAVLDLLLGLGRSAGTTLLMVTHDLDTAAKADRIIEIKDGRIDNERARQNV